MTSSIGESKRGFWSSLASWLKQPIIGWGAILALVASIVIPWKLSTAGGALTYAVSEPQSLLKTQTAGEHKLILLFDGKKVQDPYLTEVHIENTGCKPISPDAFTDSFEGCGKGIKLSTASNTCTILGVDLVAMKPPDRVPAELTIFHNLLEEQGGKKQNSAICLRAVALNPGESLDIQIVSDGEPTSITMVGHITDCTLQRTSDFRDFNSILSFIWKVFQTVGTFLSYLIFGIVLLTGYAIYSFWMWFLSLFRWWGFDGRVEKLVPSATEALEILQSDKKLKELALEVNVKGNKERERLKESLSKIVASKLIKPAEIQTQTPELATKGGDEPAIESAPKTTTLEETLNLANADDSNLADTIDNSNLEAANSPKEIGSDPKTSSSPDEGDG